jgi:hypothetical protein
MSNIKAVDLNQLGQGGQPYLAFPFSKGSLRLFKEIIKNLTEPSYTWLLRNLLVFREKTQSFTFLVQLLSFPRYVVSLDPQLKFKYAMAVLDIASIGIKKYYSNVSV